jgi:hypothetical protein
MEMSREQIVYLPIEEIMTAPQVRKQPDPEPDEGLAISIRESGLPTGHTRCQAWTLGRTNTVRIRFVYRSVAVGFLRSLFKILGE